MNRLPFLIAGAVIALLLLLGSVYRIDESQTGIVLNLGRIVRSGLAPGLHFKWPIVEQVRVFDRRILTLDAQPERYLTSEKRDVSVDFFVKWRISDVTAYYRATSGVEETAIQRLTPIVKDALRNEINQRTLQEVVAGGRTDVAARQLKTINEGAKTLGISVVDVRIKSIELPADSQVLDSVFERMRAERQRVANELRAEGFEAAEKIRADADRERQVILAEAERDAQRLRGEGDARAAEIYARAYGQDAEFYSFHRSLESYRRAFADGKSVLVLDQDSDFLRYFDETGRPRVAE